MKVNDIIGFYYNTSNEQGYFRGTVIKKNNKIIIVKDENGTRQFYRNEINGVIKY